MLESEVTNFFEGKNDQTNREIWIFINYRMNAYWIRETGNYWFYYVYVLDSIFMTRTEGKYIIAGLQRWKEKYVKMNRIRCGKKN